MGELREAVLRLCRTMNSMGIPFAAGGSFASSIHEIARSTQDLDIVAAITLQDAEPFATALRGEFYVDEESIRDAVRHGRSFNVIHLGTAFKIDIFPASSQPLGRQELERRRLETSSQLGGEPAELPV